MPAQIIQTNTAPFAQVPIDPVTLDIIENAMRNARIEMDATHVRRRPYQRPEAPPPPKPPPKPPPPPPKRPPP